MTLGLQPLAFALDHPLSPLNRIQDRLAEVRQGGGLELFVFQELCDQCVVVRHPLDHQILDQRQDAEQELVGRVVAGEADDFIVSGRLLPDLFEEVTVLGR